MGNDLPTHMAAISAYHSKFSVQDFTTFKSLDLSFGKGLNVILGGNGTGKTHLLKVLYSLDKVRSQRPELRKDESNEASMAVTWSDFRRQLEKVFAPEKFSDVYRRGSESCRFEATWGDGATARIALENGKSYSEEFGLDRPFHPSVFIPSHDILGHSLGFRSLYSHREIDFDQTFADLLDAAYLNPLRDRSELRLLPLIEKMIGGRVITRGERFYIESETGDHATELHMVAEGWRKLALLYLLIQNGSLGAGRILFWDEPEANLNPSYMDDVIEIVLALARSGTQIILTTHDYVILKEIDLHARPQDQISYFALEATNEGTVVQSASDFASLKPNLILDQFDSLLVRDLRRTSGSEEDLEGLAG
jgi:ABC-type lipoprotein export system ATPase subunit